MELKKKEQPKSEVVEATKDQEKIESPEEFVSQKNAVSVSVDKKFVTIKIMPGIIEHMSNHFSYDYMIIKYLKDGSGGADVTAYRDSMNVD